MSFSETPSRSRYRSVPNRSVYRSAVLWTLLHAVFVLSSIGLLFWFCFHHPLLAFKPYRPFFIVGIVGSLLTLIISYSKRRNARCPLCLGTPLRDSGALAHKKAETWGPLDPAHTAMVQILFTQKFRCMYCGTRYDLRKMSRAERERDQELL